MIAFLGNRFLSSAVAVGAIGFFAFIRIDGQPAGLVLWQLFGTTNQILGGLTLLVVAVYLYRRGSRWLAVGLPMVFTVATTLLAMSIKIADFYREDSWLLLGVGSILLALSLWLVVEGASTVLGGSRDAPRL